MGVSGLIIRLRVVGFLGFIGYRGLMGLGLIRLIGSTWFAKQVTLYTGCLLRVRVALDL